MPESDVDIDSLGTLTLEHFEKETCDESYLARYPTGNSQSPSSYHSEDSESPLSSPNGLSSPCTSPSTSDDDVCGKFFPVKKKPEKRQGKQAISKRNERERKRVKLISEGFSTLRKHVLAGEPNNRKVPKLQILRMAIQYIQEMQNMLDEDDRQMKIENQRKHHCYVQPELQTSLGPCHSIVKQEEMFPCHHSNYARPVPEQYQFERVFNQRDVPWFYDGYTQ